MIHFLHGFLHLHVPECVDQRVEHGSNDGVEKSKHFVFWESNGWSNINRVKEQKKRTTTMMWELHVERALRRFSAE